MDQRVLSSDSKNVPVPIVGRDTFKHSILNVEVSCFKNAYSSDFPAKVNLLSWLTSAKYEPRQAQIRAMESKTERDEVKVLLPGITPSGLFEGGRKEVDFVQHSGFIQFDIDHKGNERIMNYTDLKQQIKNLKNVAYCGLSVSGGGYWGLYSNCLS